MSGFAPRGHYPFRAIRDIMGPDTLGAWLASGDFIAHAVGDDGEILPINAEVWRTADASPIMAAGQLTPADGEPVPLLITSRRLGDLIAIMDARARRATKEAAKQPKAANDPGSSTSATEASALKAFRAIVSEGRERMTKSAAEAEIRKSHPTLGVLAWGRIWTKAAPPEWRQAGRPPIR